MPPTPTHDLITDGALSRQISTAVSRQQSSVTTPPTVFTRTIRGASNLNGGTHNRLLRIMNPTTRGTIMLALDRGYFRVPTTFLERIDLKTASNYDPADALAPGDNFACRLILELARDLCCAPQVNYQS